MEEMLRKNGSNIEEMAAQVAQEIRNFNITAKGQSPLLSPAARSSNSLADKTNTPQV